MTAALGTPVDPDVNIKYAGASGSGRDIMSVSSYRSIVSSQRAWVRCFSERISLGRHDEIIFFSRAAGVSGSITQYAAEVFSAASMQENKGAPFSAIKKMTSRGRTCRSISHLAV